ncbi:heat shock factor protein 5 [Hyla sarda]|uniref:heat shock factor protein 5 n=1 Tax=Hyla sarda TaxID=327740 RepID=UPI0024C43693|nr:heat shock factor protein 5 [Hyla sarda]
MEPDKSITFNLVNPNNFPGKLWRLVNNPVYQSIRWDSTGNGIIIDQHLIEYELLCPKRMAEATDLFKTTNFNSFIRQLNLYGFRKVVLGSDSTTGVSHPDGNKGVDQAGLHYFCNGYFQKNRPDLLVNMKRLTSINKAKLAAGIKVNSRPPNRFQRMITSAVTEKSKEHGENKGLITVEQSEIADRRENISPYPYVNPLSNNYNAFPGIGHDCASIRPRTWSNSFGLHQRQLASHSSFPENGMFYPVLQCFPSDITYTMQATATSIHVQQNHSAMPGSMQTYSGYMPHTAQYHQAYYPSAFLPRYTTPAHPYLSGCRGPAVSSFPNCSYFQNPPMQSSYPMEFFHTNWSSSNLNPFRKDERNLEPAIQLPNDLQSTQLETVQLDTVESLAGLAASPLQNETSAGALSPENDEIYCNPTNHLESLLSINAEITSEALLADQPVNCQSQLTSSNDFPLNSDQTEVPPVADKFLYVEADLLASDVTSSSEIAKCE